MHSLHHNRENHDLNLHRRENLKFRDTIFIWVTPAPGGQFSFHNHRTHHTVVRGTHTQHGFFTYEGVSTSFRTDSITKIHSYNNKHSLRSNTKRVTAAKLTRLTHKIAIQLHLAAEIRTIRSSRSRRLVRKLLDTPGYICYTHIF
jgi:hypothetical protein